MKRSASRKTVNTVVGLLILLFTVIGLVCTVRFAATQIKHLNAVHKQYPQYQDFLSAVVMNDPSTFDDVSVADRKELLAIAIWDILTHDPDPDAYEYYEGEMMLPKEQVETSFARLFGEEIKPVHTDVDGGGLTFAFSEAKNCYLIPITGVTPIYTPKILAAEKQRSQIVLTVGYLAGEDFEEDENGVLVAGEPAKYMQITLRVRADSSYYISAIRSAEQ